MYKSSLENSDGHTWAEITDITPTGPVSAAGSRAQTIAKLVKYFELIEQENGNVPIPQATITPIFRNTLQ